MRSGLTEPEHDDELGDNHAQEHTEGIDRDIIIGMRFYDLTLGKNLK